MGIAKKPWLLVNKELRNYYPFIGRNIKKKLGLKKTLAAETKPANYVFNESVGLVVIGVHPNYRGKGIFELLMKEFEQKALQLNIKNCNLSVRGDNARAIAAYSKMGWETLSQKNNALIMFKKL
jgi:ribosomal protein S18 acetylase RimI-like enzyme